MIYGSSPWPFLQQLPRIASWTPPSPGLCKRRRDYPDHADVWEFRRNWPQEKDRIRTELPSGRYRFGLLDRVALANGDEIDLWSARDALVLKALAIVLADLLPVSALSRDMAGPRRRCGR